MTVTLAHSIKINASQQLVFKAATDWVRQNEWMLLTTVKPSYLDGRTAGGKIEAITGFMGIGFLDSMTITDWREPDLCRVIHTGKVVRGSGTFKVIKTNEAQSIFEWSEDVILPFGMLGRLGWFVVRPIAKFGVVFSLKRFKKWVETDYKR